MMTVGKNHKVNSVLQCCWKVGCFVGPSNYSNLSSVDFVALKQYHSIYAFVSGGYIFLDIIITTTARCFCDLNVTLPCFVELGLSCSKVLIDRLQSWQSKYVEVSVLNWW